MLLNCSINPFLFSLYTQIDFVVVTNLPDVLKDGKKLYLREILLVLIVNCLYCHASKRYHEAFQVKTL